MERYDITSCCEIRNLLIPFCNGETDADQSSQIKTHIGQCVECRRVFCTLLRVSSSKRQTRYSRESNCRMHFPRPILMRCGVTSIPQPIPVKQSFARIPRRWPSRILNFLRTYPC